MMTQDEALLLLSARLDGELTPEQERELEAWLNEHPDGRVIAEAFQAQHSELRGAFEPRRLAAAHTAERLALHLAGPATPLAAPPEQPRAQRRRFWSFVPPLTALAVVVVVVVFGLSPRKDASDARTTVTGPSKSPGRAVYEVLTAKAKPSAPPAPVAAVGDQLATQAGEKRRVMLADGSVLFMNQNASVKLKAERCLQLECGQVYIEAAPTNESLGRGAFQVEAPGRTLTALGTKFAVDAVDTSLSLLVTQGQVKLGDGAEPVVAGQVLHADLKKIEEVQPAKRASYELDWTRDLMIAADAPLVPAGRYDGGALVAVDPYGQEAKLSLVNYHIDVHIEDGFARTTIDQTYFNAENFQMEGTFYFPLPPDASLTRLAMYVANGETCNLMEGGMAERDIARQTYETVRHARRDPALLEWVDGSLFKMRVFPLEARQEKRLILSYTQRLPVQYGRTTYRFPAGHTLNSVKQWSFQAFVKGGATLKAGSPSHPNMKIEPAGNDLLLRDRAEHVKPDRDVVLELTEPGLPAGDSVRWSSAEHEKAKYLMFRFRPELTGPARRERRDWAFLFEASGARDPLVARTQVEIIRAMLNNAEHDDTFALLAVGTRVHPFSEERLPATAENISNAIAFLEKTQLIGTLNLEQGLAMAASCLDGGANPHLVHVGGGVATLGEQRADKLIQRLAPGTRYVGVAVGKRFSPAFMKVAAECTGGFFTQINPDEPVAWRGFELVSALNAPRLLNLTVSVPERAGEESPARFLPFANAMSQGEELAAVARIDGAMPSAVNIRGTLNGVSFERTIEVKDIAANAGYLPRTWAKLEIDRLLADDAAKQRQAIVELSKAMYVMTPFTSLLVLENEQMYKEFKVDRGRKDHWAMYPCPEKIPTVYVPDADQPAVSNAPKFTERKPHENVVRQTIVTRAPQQFSRGEGEQDLNTPMSSRSFEEFGVEFGLEFRRAPILYTRGTLTNPSDSVLYKPLPTGGTSGVTFSEPYSKVPSSSLAAGMDQFGVELGIESTEPPRIMDVKIIGNTVTRDNVIGRQISTNMAGGSTDHLYYFLQAPELPRPDANLGKNDLESLGKNHFDSWTVGLRLDMPLALGIRNDDNAAIRAERLSRLRSRFREDTDLKKLGDDLSYDWAPGVTEQIGGEGYYGQAQFVAASILVSDHSQPLRLTTPSRYIDAVLKQAERGPRYYNRPPIHANDRVFMDLTAYAPGMTSSTADIRAAVEAEAAPRAGLRRGVIDPHARQRIESARQAGWRGLAFKDSAGKECLFHYDGQGRFACARRVEFGLIERIVCDGSTILHLYPELGIGARRNVSRFHRAELCQRFPELLPPADDLNFGFDVKLIDADTVALVPLKPADAEEPRRQWVETHLVFQGNRLAERRWLMMPAKKEIGRAVFGADESILLVDAGGKEVSKDTRTTKPAAAPDLNPDLTALVVLPLPLRSRETAYGKYDLNANRPNLDDPEGSLEYLTPEAALELLTAEFAAGNGQNVEQIWRNCFAERGDHRLGFLTLLVSSGASPDGQSFRERLNELTRTNSITPLSRYLSLAFDPNTVWLQQRFGALSGEKPADDFLSNLLAFRLLSLRWQSEAVAGRYWGYRSSEREHDLAFARKHAANAWGWSALTMLADRAGEAHFHRQIAAVWAQLAEKSGLPFHARYEQAASLLKGGQPAEARASFRRLFADLFAKGVQPPLDMRFRDAFFKDANGADWRTLMREAAQQCIASKRRPAVVMLAWQCRQLGDQALADELLGQALAGDAGELEHATTMLTAIQYLLNIRDIDQADALVRRVLEIKELRQPPVWRLAGQIAAERGDRLRQIECLEQALGGEFERIPAVFSIDPIRRDYAALLNHYEWLAEASRNLRIEPPADLAARVVQAADRWRRLDPDGTGACQQAARILRMLGGPEAEALAWDYVTTPLALRPNEAEPWLALAHDAVREGRLALADQCYEAAFAAEPTNAEILWERAKLLERHGEIARSRELFKQLAAGNWQPRFQGLKDQSRLLGEGP
jgi:ferric-dicitrate binding protein FerR (iron transport regulator)/tetratricopeptide (TPR) repeat protein